LSTAEKNNDKSSPLSAEFAKKNCALRQQIAETYKNCGSLRGTAKIANLRQNVKIAEKLRPATS